jgi:translation initiation factor IF-1
LSRDSPLCYEERTEGAVARADLIQIQGTVKEILAGGQFRVESDKGQQFLAKIGGRMRRFHIKVIPGDKVTVEVSPYDPSHGLIVYRVG